MKAVLLAWGLLALLAAVGVGGYLLGNRADDSKELVGKATSPAARAVVVELPVVELPTTHGAYEGVPSETPLKERTVTSIVPESLVDRLSGYSGAGIMILGPKGWAGQSIVGANGNRSIEISPTGDSSEGPMVTVFLASPGTLSAILPAAPFSEWIRDHWQEVGGGPGPVPTAIPGIVDSTPHLVRYQLPVVAGLQTHGAAYSEVQDVSGSSYGYFDQIEVSLPAEDSQLAAAIVDNFIITTNFPTQ